MRRHAPSIGLGLGLSLRSQGPGFRGLLDQYGGAAAAYSLRALSSGWLAGDVVEVRRSSDGTLQSFTAGQITNGDLVAFTGAGDGFVSTWYDQSGFANDATQAFTTSQPKIVSAGALVVGGLDFDGVDDYFDLSNLFTGAVGASSMYVGRARTTATSEAMLSQGDTSGVLGTSYSITSEIAFRCAGNTIYDTSFESASQMLLSSFHPVSATSADVDMYIDGSIIGQISTTTTTLNYTNQVSTIGKNQSSASRFDGLMTELIVYASDQSANRVAIETNINDFYSIYA